MIAWTCVHGASEQKVCRLNLAPFGFNVDARHRAADYSGLTFLADNLLLVSIVQRHFLPGAQPMLVDTPSSTLLLVDINQRRVISRTEVPVEKWSGAVQFAGTGRFVLWNQSGIRVCAVNFQCGSSMHAQELKLVSPKGATAVVLDYRNEERNLTGGYGELEIVDLRQMSIVATLPRRLPQEDIIPGDGVLLIRDLKRTFIRQPGGQDQPLQFDGRGTFNRSRFLDARTFAYFDWDSSQAVVATLGPRELYRLPVQKVWQAGFIPTLNGTRFGLYEHGYTSWNSLLNFYDIDESRPENFQRIRVFETSSSHKIAEFNWDPRPHLIEPALSPDGSRLARVRGAMLEVVDVS